MLYYFVCGNKYIFSCQSLPARELRPLGFASLAQSGLTNVFKSNHHSIQITIDIYLVEGKGRFQRKV